MTDDLVERLRAGIHTSIDHLVLNNDAADRIEKLEAALAHIWAWYPTSVSRPQDTIDAIKDFAFATIKGDKND